METKILEIRDSMTFFYVLCVDMNPSDQYERTALRTYGFPCDSAPNIMMTHLSLNGDATNDPYDWGDRTRQIAHNFIINNWENLNQGDVIDVEFILGETTEKKKPQHEEGEQWTR